MFNLNKVIWILKGKNDSWYFGKIFPPHTLEYFNHYNVYSDASDFVGPSSSRIVASTERSIATEWESICKGIRRLRFQYPFPVGEFTMYKTCENDAFFVTTS